MPEIQPHERIYFRFVRLQQRIYAEMARTQKRLGLSIPQFDVLSTLTEEEGLSQSDLAARLYVTKGNVSGLIDRLVEARLVERRNAPGDRRSNAVFLTDAGRKAAEAGIELQRIFITQTLGKVSGDDLAVLDRIITQWRDAIRTRADSK